MTAEWDDVGYVISSTYRTAVLRRLAEGPSTPSQIGTDEDIAVAHASRALQQLRDRSMVDLLVPEDRRKGRVYRLSEKGEEVWDQTKKHNLV